VVVSVQATRSSNFPPPLDISRFPPPLPGFFWFLFSSTASQDSTPWGCHRKGSPFPSPGAFFGFSSFLLPLLIELLPLFLRIPFLQHHPAQRRTNERPLLLLKFSPPASEFSGFLSLSRSLFNLFSLLSSNVSPASFDTTWTFFVFDAFQLLPVDAPFYVRFFFMMEWPLFFFPSSFSRDSLSFFFLFQPPFLDPRNFFLWQRP